MSRGSATGWPVLPISRAPATSAAAAGWSVGECRSHARFQYLKQPVDSMVWRYKICGCHQTVTNPVHRCTGYMTLESMAKFECCFATLPRRLERAPTAGNISRYADCISAGTAEGALLLPLIQTDFARRKPGVHCGEAATIFASLHQVRLFLDRRASCVNVVIARYSCSFGQDRVGHSGHRQMPVAEAAHIHGFYNPPIALGARLLVPQRLCNQTEASCLPPASWSPLQIGRFTTTGRRWSEPSRRGDAGPVGQPLFNVEAVARAGYREVKHTTLRRDAASDPRQTFG